MDLVVCVLGGGMMVVWLWLGCVLFGMVGCLFVLLDVKRGIAYGTVVQMNLCLMVMVVGDWCCGVVMFVVHGFYKSSMFMCVGL